MTKTTAKRVQVSTTLRRSRRRAVLVLCVLSGAGALPALACGGGSKPAAAPEPTENSALDEKKAPAESASASASASASTSAAPDTAPLAQVLETDPAAIQKVFDAMNAAPPAKLKDDGLKKGDGVAKGIKEASKKLPAGMKPEGPLAVGNVPEKQHLRTDITLAPGKCYSILGFSPTVKDLDLYLLLPPGILSGQDLTDDNKPIIGGPPSPMCPVAQTSVTYKLDIFADHGGGDVAVQLFSKSN